MIIRKGNNSILKIIIGLWLNLMLNILKNLVKEIYDDRKLLFDFAGKDFKRKFAGSFLGIGWAFIQPVLIIIIYWLVFQFGFRSGDIGTVPFVLWFMCGMVPWLFISEAFSVASNSFLEYNYLVKKVIFNINILPLVKILSSMFIHLFFILLLIIVCSILGYYPSIFIVQIIYYIICSIAFVFAVSLICSSIMVFFRDLNQIISIILLIGMWGTPIVWNINIIPESIRFYLKLNPIYYIVEGYRDSFVSNIWFWEKYDQMIYFWILTIVLMSVGSLIYNRLKIHFADVL